MVLQHIGKKMPHLGAAVKYCNFEFHHASLYFHHQFQKNFFFTYFFLHIKHTKRINFTIFCYLNQRKKWGGGWGGHYQRKSFRVKALGKMTVSRRKTIKTSAPPIFTSVQFSLILNTYPFTLIICTRKTYQPAPTGPHYSSGEEKPATF